MLQGYSGGADDCGGDGKIWSVGKVVGAFFPGGDEKEKRGGSAQHKAEGSGGGSVAAAEPDADGGKQLYVAAEDAALHEDCQQQHYDAGGCAGQQGVEREGRRYGVQPGEGGRIFRQAASQKGVKKPGGSKK